MRPLADPLHIKFRALGARMYNAESGMASHLALPKTHRTRIHSTRPLERLNAQARPRTVVVVTNFSNDASVVRDRHAEPAGPMQFPSPPLTGSPGKS